MTEALSWTVNILQLLQWTFGVNVLQNILKMIKTILSRAVDIIKGLLKTYRYIFQQIKIFGRRRVGAWRTRAQAVLSVVEILTMLAGLVWIFSSALFED
jgi:hypothetical protein